MSLMERVERRARSVSPTTVDTTMALLFTAITLGTLYGASVAPGYREANGWALLAAPAAAGPMAFRRRYPNLALAVAFTATFVYYGLGDFPEGFMPIDCLILTYSASAWSDRNRAPVGLLLIGVTVLGLHLKEAGDFEIGSTVVFFVGAWLAGAAVRARRDGVEAEMRVVAERAKISDQRAARLVAEERLRIAQELHDVVAHSMSVIAVQAGAGSHLLDADPGQARAALDAISDTSRATLGEMRRLLGVLRGENGGPAHAPAPAVADLPRLVDDVRAIGLPVDLHISDPGHGTNQAIELSAYRIVQEALTNVIKHAGEPSAVSVRVEYFPSELRIEVADNGRGLAAGASDPAGVDGADETGHGLVGMRERVEVWGGELETGPRPGGGYRVRARLPYGVDA